MKLKPDQKLCLEELYLHYAIPTDQLRRTPAVLNKLTSAFCGMTGISVEPAELLRYMMNRRKNRDWPCLGDRARRFPQAVNALTDHQLTFLKEIYVELDVTSDEILLQPSVSKQFCALFAKRAGVILPAHTLIPALFQLRKRGLLPTIREEVEKENKSAAKAFGDIAEVVRKYGTGGK